MKIITENKQARFEYFVEETYKTGIVLEGAEVKSIRAGNINLKDSFCSLYRGEVFLNNTHIAVYDKSGAFNSKDSRRSRKLLLRRAEINKIVGKVNEKGYTLIPLNAFFEGSLVKITIGQELKNYYASLFFRLIGNNIHRHSQNSETLCYKIHFFLLLRSKMIHPRNCSTFP